jgi:glycine betaine/proline transport system ATP-binding protein
MDPVGGETDLSDLKVSAEAIIATVAETVLSEQKPVAVLDANDNVVGLLHSSKIIHVLFGENSSLENKG